MQIKSDLVIVWPINCDYPLWRQMLRAHRNKFNKVIIGFMQTNDGTDYREFIQQAMRPDGVEFIQPFAYDGRKDWRNVITNQCLRKSIADWVYFTEQDFFFGSSFWTYVEGMIETPGVDYIGVMDGERLHPCSLFVRRKALSKTCRDFGVSSAGDHYRLIQNDLERNAVGYILPESAYIHMNGLSHNLKLMTSGQQPNYKKEVFDNYLHRCLLCDVPLEPGFVSLVKSYLGDV